MDRKQLIGREFPPVTSVISEEDVRDFTRVIGDEYPAPKGSDADRQAMPPSFAPLIALRSILRAVDWEKDFALDYATGTAMFGEQKMDYTRPLYVGERLTIRGTVAGVVEKHGAKPFDVVTMLIDATDSAGGRAFSGSMGFILFK